MEKKLKLKITGMHCVSCAMNIDGELEDSGVKESITSYAKGVTDVIFDDAQITQENMIAVIEKLGYAAIVYSH